MSTESKPVLVILTKRKPPMWSVKVGARYKASFIGPDAKRRAISAAAEYGKYEIREPAAKRGK